MQPATYLCALLRCNLNTAVRVDVPTAVTVYLSRGSPYTRTVLSRYPRPPALRTGLRGARREPRRSVRPHRVPSILRVAQGQVHRAHLQVHGRVVDRQARLSRLRCRALELL